MRDIAILIVYVALLVWAIKERSPFIALMVYYWISFMNPHRFSWGFVYSLPLAMGAAAVTFLTIILSHDDIKISRTRETFLFRQNDHL